MISGRYIFTLLACLGLILNLLGRDTLSLAIISMKEDLNLTKAEVANVQLVCKAGYGYGMTFSIIIGGPLSDILGGKWLLLLVNVLSGLLTALVPILASISTPCLVTAQVLYGLAGGLVVPALSSMIARWEPISERGRLATVIYSGTSISKVCTALFIAFLSHLGQDWRITFYILGSLPILWILPWVTLVTDNPANSILTSQSERALLEAEVPISQQRPTLKDIPVWRMVTSAPVWAMIVGNIGCSWAAVHTSQLLPLYLNDVIQLEFTHTSLLSTLPFLGCCLTCVRKICSSFCLFGFAALTLSVPFLQSKTIPTVVTVTAAFAMTGFNLVGAWSNSLDLAPNFVGTLMGVSGLFNNLTASLVPHTRSLLTSLFPVESELWTGLFLTVSTITITANLVFLLLGSGKLQDWNTVEGGKELKNTAAISISQKIKNHLACRGGISRRFSI